MQPTSPISQSSRERRLSPSIAWPAAASLRSSRNPGCSPALDVAVELYVSLSEETLTVFAGAQVGPGALRCWRLVRTRVGEAASAVDSPTRGGTAPIHRRCAGCHLMSPLDHMPRLIYDKSKRRSLDRMLSRQAARGCSGRFSRRAVPCARASGLLYRERLPARANR